MNNKISRFFGLMVAGFCFTIFGLGSVFGAVSLPIGSEDQLREYALDKVVRGYKDVSADSIQEVSGYNLFAKVVGNGAEDVIDKLLSVPISFSLINTNDDIVSRIWLYDDRDRLLFYGQSTYKVDTIGKGGNSPQYNIWMQEIPLLDNVSFANLFVVNDEGVTSSSRSLLVKDGQIMFDPYLAGSVNVFMGVKFTDDTEMVFDLSDPKSVTPPTITSSSSNWSVEGHHVIPPSEGDVVQIKFIESNHLPTVLVTVGVGQKVELDVMGAYYNEKGVIVFERPNHIFISEVGGEGWGGEGDLPPYAVSTLPIPQNRPGVYRIRFGWEHFHQGRRLYYGPDDGMGKG